MRILIYFHKSRLTLCKLPILFIVKKKILMLCVVNLFQSHGVCVTVQDATKMTPSGYNEKKGISVWTYGGRQVIAAEK